MSHYLMPSPVILSLDELSHDKTAEPKQYSYLENDQSQRIIFLEKVHILIKTLSPMLSQI